MHEKLEPHMKGFLLEQNEEKALLWLRRDGVLLQPTQGAVPFVDRRMHEGNEYAIREFVQGLSLREFSKRQTFSLSMFVHTIRRAMDGLE